MLYVVMSKIARLFTIDVDVYEKAQVMRFNLSEAAENGIRHEINRLGGDVKTIDELLVEREIEDRKRKVKEAEAEAAKALAHSQGKMYVDENSPAEIDIRKFQKKRF